MLKFFKKLFGICDHEFSDEVKNDVIWHPSDAYNGYPYIQPYKYVECVKCGKRRVTWKSFSSSKSRG